MVKGILELADYIDDSFLHLLIILAIFIMIVSSIAIIISGIESIIKNLTVRSVAKYSIDKEDSSILSEYIKTNQD